MYGNLIKKLAIKAKSNYSNGNQRNGGIPLHILLKQQKSGNKADK